MQLTDFSKLQCAVEFAVFYFRFIELFQIVDGWTWVGMDDTPMPACKTNSAIGLRWM